MSPLLGLKMDFQKILQFSHLMQHPFKNKKNKDDGEPEVRKKSLTFTFSHVEF